MQLHGRRHGRRVGDRVGDAGDGGAFCGVAEEKWRESRDVVWGSWGGANAPPKNFFAPPKDSLGGAK